MDKRDFIIGFFIGLIVAFLGAFVFLYYNTHLNLYTDYELVKQQGILGKVITLGTILNIIAFFILLKMKKEFMARGIILAIISLAIYTIFI
jgi:hypothetical protein